MIRQAALICILTLVGACSTLNPAVRSMRTLEESQTRVLITDATLRNSYILHADNDSDGQAVSPHVVCVEPQPDAATQLAAKASLSGEGGRIGQDASADAVLEYNSTIIQLAGRSSTVLLARDFLFNVCLLRANGFLSDDQVFQLYGQTINLVRDLATSDKLRSAADAVQAGAPRQTVAAILGVSERELLVTEAAAALLRIESESERRALLTRVFNCGQAAVCIRQRDELIADRDLVSVTTRIGQQSGERIQALHSALTRRN